MTSTHSRATVDAILSRFRALLRSTTPWQEPDLPRLDVTMTQAKCLSVVSLCPGIAMSALAARLQVGAPAASGLVDRLVEHGYLQRCEDPADRRQQLVSLTPGGRAIADRFHSISAPRLRRLLAGLSQAEREALLLGLAALEREASLLDAVPSGPRHERTPA